MEKYRLKERLSVDLILKHILEWNHRISNTVKQMMGYKILFLETSYLSFFTELKMHFPEEPVSG